MGVVYKARQRSLNRLVALKMILAGQFATPAERERFRAEAENAARLDHPNIVPIHEVGEHDGLPFFSMKLIEGDSLARSRERFRDDPRAAALVVRQVAEAIHHAHQRGILHRDLKPANVLFDRDGVAHVTDFGLARRLGGEGLTGSGALVGTPAYMAPEQAQGKAGLLTVATDVYGLGALLYELLTGKPPFSGETPMDVLVAVLHDEPEPPSRRNAVPVDLELVCLKCLRKEPARRFGSAAEVAEELDAFLEGRPVRARPVPTWERVWMWARRRPAVAGLLAAIVMLAVGAVTVTGVLYRNAVGEARRAHMAEQDAEEDRIHARAAEKRARDEEATTRTEKERAEKQLDRAERLLYASQSQAAHREWLAGNVAQAWAHLESCRWDFRGLEHRYLFNLFNHNQITLAGHSGGVTSHAISGDGSRIATGGSDGTVKVWDGHSLQELHTLRCHKGDVYRMVIGPNNRLLASYGVDGTVKVWDIRSGKRVNTLRGRFDLPAATSLGISADGNHIVTMTSPLAWDARTGRSTWTVATWDARTGKVLSSFPFGFRQVRISTDARHIFDANGTIWEARTHKELITLEGHPTTEEVVFSPDGKRIATGGKDRMIRVWDARSGKLQHTLQGHTDFVFALAFSPDGNRIASGSWDGTVKVWHTAQPIALTTLRGHRGWVNSVAFSADGRRIISGGYDGVKVWDLRPSISRPTLQVPPGGSSAVDVGAISADGERVVGGWDKKVMVWDARSGNVLLGMGEHPNFVQSLAVSSDGSRFAIGSTSIRSSGHSIVSVWDVGSGRDPVTLEGPANYSGWNLTLSPDGSRIVTVLQDGSMKLWDAHTGRGLFTFPGGPVLYAGLVFSHDSQRLVATAPGGTLKVWDVHTGKQQHTLRGPSGPFYNLVISRDGGHIVASSADGIIWVWDGHSGKAIHTFRTRATFIDEVVISPDGRHVVSVGREGALQVWDTRSGKERWPRWNPGKTRGVAISADGNRLATGGQDGFVRVWNFRTGKELLTLRGNQEGTWKMAFNPDGSRLVSLGWRGTVLVWDAHSGKTLISRGGGRRNQGLHAGLISRDANCIIDVSAYAVRILDTRSGKGLFPIKGHSEEIRSVAISTDGNRIVSGSWDGTVRLWDARTGKHLVALEPSPTRVSSVAISDDGGRIASGSEDGTVKVWDGHSFKKLFAGKVASLPQRRNPYHGVAISPDGRRIASGGGDDTTVRVWDVDSGKEVFVLRGHSAVVCSVAFSADGSRIASGAQDTLIKVWNACTGVELLSLSGHAGIVLNVAFTHDDSRIVSGSRDRTVRLWDTRLGKELLNLKGETDKIWRLLVSQDGRRFISTGWGDPSTMVWDATLEMDSLTLKGHTAPIRGVAVSRDGTRILARDETGKVLAWDAATGQLVPDAPAHLSEARQEATSPDGRLRVRVVDGQVQVDFVEAQKRRQARDRERIEQLNRFDPGWHRSQVDEALKDGDDFAAAFHLKRLLGEQPWDASLHIHLAHVLTRMGQHQESAVHLARALLLHPRVLLWPSDPWAVQRGERAAGIGDWPRAVREFQLASHQPQVTPTSFTNLLLAQCAAGDRTAAGKTVASQAHRLADAKEAPFHNVLVYYARVATWDAVTATAFLAFTGRALERSRDANTLHNHGVSLYRAGSYAEAERTLAESAKVQGQGGFVDTLLFQAMASQHNGKAAEAIALLERFENWHRQQKSATWQQRVLWDTLRAEARQLVLTPPPMRKLTPDE
jgi:WD40 repeat protein